MGDSSSCLSFVRDKTSSFPLNLARTASFSLTHWAVLYAGTQTCTGVHAVWTPGCQPLGHPWRAGGCQTHRGKIGIYSWTWWPSRTLFWNAVPPEWWIFLPSYKVILLTGFIFPSDYYFSLTLPSISVRFQDFCNQSRLGVDEAWGSQGTYSIAQGSH